VYNTVYPAVDFVTWVDFSRSISPWKRPNICNRACTFVVIQQQQLVAAQASEQQQQQQQENILPAPLSSSSSIQPPPPLSILDLDWLWLHRYDEAALLARSKAAAAAAGTNQWITTTTEQPTTTHQGGIIRSGTLLLRVPFDTVVVVDNMAVANPQQNVHHTETTTTTTTTTAMELATFQLLDASVRQGETIVTQVPDPSTAADNASPVAQLGRVLAGGADYQSPPGLQLLHCVVQSPDQVGGESILIDAMAATERLRILDPWAFDILTKMSSHLL
jgi:Taurine catabolism dioxygenase TauD, TfdA family